jgi:hypothetical protein
MILVMSKMVVVMNVCFISCNETTAVTNTTTVVLQTCLDLEKDLPDFWSVTSPTSSHDANKFINTKSEEVSDVEEEEDPVPISFPQIKGEHEVSCVS